MEVVAGEVCGQSLVQAVQRTLHGVQSGAALHGSTAMGSVCVCVCVWACVRMSAKE